MLLFITSSFKWSKQQYHIKIWMSTLVSAKYVYLCLKHTGFGGHHEVVHRHKKLEIRGKLVSQ